MVTVRAQRYEIISLVLWWLCVVAYSMRVFPRQAQNIIERRSKASQEQTILGMSKPEVYLALFLCLVQIGLSMIDIPHKFWIALVCWSLITALGIHLIFIWERTIGWAKLAKISSSLFFVFLIFGFVYDPLRREWDRENVAESKTMVSLYPAPILNVNRSLTLGNFILIPWSEEEKTTQVNMQLLPPLEDEHRERYIINAVLISVTNNGPLTDQSVSLKVYLPGAREVSCDNERINVVEGSVGSTSVNLLIPEIKPQENLTCKIDLLQLVNDAPTVTDWKKRFGLLEAWSQLHGTFEVFIYRVSFGPEVSTPKGPRPFQRKVTFH